METDIRTMEILKGQLPKKVYNLVIEWAIEHRAELMIDWELMRNDSQPNPIKHLV